MEELSREKFLTRVDKKQRRHIIDAMLTLRFMLLPHLSAHRLLNPRNWLWDIKEKRLSASHEL